MLSIGLLEKQQLIKLILSVIIMKLSTFIFSASIAFSSTAVFASGGGGGGGYGGGGGFGGGQVQQRQVDQTYEVGKAIYNGRQSGFPKLSYCVVAEG